MFMASTYYGYMSMKTVFINIWTKTQSPLHRPNKTVT